MKRKHAAYGEPQWAVQWWDGAMLKGWTEPAARNLYEDHPSQFVALQRYDFTPSTGSQWVDVERRAAVQPATGRRAQTAQVAHTLRADRTSVDASTDPARASIACQDDGDGVRDRS